MSSAVSTSHEQPSVDVLLVTATPVETKQLHTELRRVGGKHSSTHIKGFPYFDLGIIKDARVFHTQCQIGTATPGGSLSTIKRAIEALHPKAVILVGIAFGIPEKVKLGTILISRQVRCYDYLAVKTDEQGQPDIRWRGDKVTASTWLLAKVDHLMADWKGPPCEKGLLLSGDKLVANDEFRSWLRSEEPDIIGGEMEASGGYVATTDQLQPVHWLVVKAVSDLGDHEKNKGDEEKRQATAARNAARFTFRLLDQGGWGSGNDYHDGAPTPQSTNSGIITGNISGNPTLAIASGDINIHLPPPPDPKAELETALAELAKMPLNKVPDEYGTLPSGSSTIPYERNGYFIGRDTELCSLADTLKAGGSAVVVTGIGGVGKTSLASEFALRYGCFFSGCYWVDCANTETIAAQFMVLGSLMKLQSYAELSNEEKIARVQSELQEAIPRLLIFDNCDGHEAQKAPAILKEWRPSSGGCRVLVTSRHMEWDSHKRLKPLQLGVLSKQAARQLLQKLCSMPDDKADKIAWELGYLPLAIHLSGHYLAYYPDTTPEQYLKAIREPSLLSHAALIGRGLGAEDMPTNHDPHVARTFLVSLQKLDSHNATDRAARALLARAAYFAFGAPIPRVLIKKTLCEFSSPVLSDDDRTDALRRLTDLGFLEKAGIAEEHQQSEKELVKIHRLISQFAHDELVDQEPADNVRSEVERTLIGAAEQVNQSDRPNDMRLIEPHLRFATARSKERKDAQIGQIFYNLGRYYYQQSDFLRARDCCTTALDIYQTAKEPGLDLAACIVLMAEIEFSQQDYAVAETYWTNALCIYQRTLGADAEETLDVERHLAALAYQMQHYDLALNKYETIYHAVAARYPDGNHLNIAECLNNIGVVLMKCDQIDRARAYFEHARIIIAQPHLRNRTPTAQILVNLGLLHLRENDPDQACEIVKKAIEIYEDVLSPKHILVAMAYMALSNIDNARGDPTARDQHLDHALSIYRYLYPQLLQDVTEEQRETPMLEAQGTTVKDLAQTECNLEKRLIATPYEQLRKRLIGVDNIHDQAADCLITRAKFRADAADDGQGSYLSALADAYLACQLLLHTVGLKHEQTAKYLSEFARSCLGLQQMPSAYILFEWVLSIYNCIPNSQLQAEIKKAKRNLQLISLYNRDNHLARFAQQNAQDLLSRSDLEAADMLGTRYKLIIQATRTLPQLFADSSSSPLFFAYQNQPQIDVGEA